MTKNFKKQLKNMYKYINNIKDTLYINIQQLIIIAR